MAGFSTASIFDLDADRASALARDFGIPRVSRTLREAVENAPSNAVFDVAVPARSIPDILRDLPDGAAVLIQKPLGENLGEARAIRDLCRLKRLHAAVNFQLRYAPGVLAARDLIARGLIGDVHDVEVRVTCQTPWNLWDFLAGIPRMEILYHSIHYVDLVRSFFGDPTGAWANTVKHPKMPELASTRTTIALDYGPMRRANITANHGHEFGPLHQESYLKIEGLRGAIQVRLGVNLDYPRGLPDIFEYCLLRDGPGPQWDSVPLEGGWFPRAFIGPMADLMRWANGETGDLPTGVDDAFRTMAVVEACYESSARGAVPIPS
jgi:predicted dehydrogenase